MTWNPSGGDKRRPGAPGAPTSASIQRLLQLWQERAPRYWRAGPTRDRAAFGLLALAVVAWLASGTYQVGSAERGVLQSFGRYVSTEMPGGGWHWPWPIQTLTKVNVSDVDSVDASAMMLTSDQSLVSLAWSVQYRINDPKQFLFHVREPQATLRRASETVVRELAAHDALAVLLSDAARTRLENATRARLQAVLQGQGVGIGVTSVSVNEVQLPDPVQAAEQQAQRASEDHRHALDQARGDADGVRAAAHQAAQRQISDAQIYATRTLADAQAEADRFNALLPAYRAAPAITREHLYIATLTDILAHAHKLFVDVRPGSGINLPAGALAAALGEGTGIERISGAAPGVSGPQQATTMQPTAASPDTGASSTPAAAGPGSGGDRGLDLERSRSREAR